LKGAKRGAPHAQTPPKSILMLADDLSFAWPMSANRSPNYMCSSFFVAPARADAREIF